MENTIDILDLTLDELQLKLKDMGIQGYRGEQVYRWLYTGASAFEDMTNIPKSMRDILDENFVIGKAETLEMQRAEDGSTTKFLSLLADGSIIESVVMEYAYGNTICISTQIGCKMGCSFCASCKAGFVRNLTPGEMMAQVLLAGKELARKNEEYTIKNIVLMGSGEPLDNYENTMSFLKNVHNPLGLNIGYRNITLSTCGVIDKIYELAGENIPITLAISLHAPNDHIRKSIMPTANKYSIEGIIEAAKYYFQETGRRVTFEYALIDGINDSPRHAMELSRRLKGFPSHVNIIPVNEIRDADYRRSSERAIGVFIDTLRKQNVKVNRRRELGQNIQGACGQLRHDYLEGYISDSKGE